MKRSENYLPRLIDHLTMKIAKGGHGFERRNLYIGGLLSTPLLERGHHYEHAKLQSTIAHNEHDGELALQRELLIAQYWTGKQWTREREMQSPLWQTITPETITGDPDLTASLLEIDRALSGSVISFRFIRNS
jgi:hypothetical protein